MSSAAKRKPLMRRAVHGVQYRYRITYRDPSPGAPDFTWTSWAYDQDAAVERFREDGDDWHIVKVERLTE